MKNWLFLFLLFPSWAFAQVKDTYPKGMYTSFQELKAKSPSLRDSFTIFQDLRDNTLKYANHKVIATKNTKEDFFETKVFAVSTGSHLFINSAMIGLQGNYTHAITEDSLLIFHSGIPIYNDSEVAQYSGETNKISREDVGIIIGGLIGGAIANASGEGDKT